MKWGVLPDPAAVLDDHGGDMHTSTTTPRATRSHVESAAGTTSSRDVWADAVRAASLLTVVLGHWLLAVVHLRPQGLEVDTILVAAPWTHWLTLAMQVMGAFFLVGGAVSVASWRRTRGRVEDVNDRDATRAYAGWLGDRVRGLVVPVLPVIGVWAVLTTALPRLGLSPTLASQAGRSALAPLWFLAVYVVVQAAVPVLDHVVARWGWQRVTGLLLAASALVDVGARGLDVAVVGLLGLVTVWSIPVVLGIALADGALGVREGRGLAVAGASSLAVLIGVVGYPVLMVGTLPDGGSNQSPPSLALAALVITHVGLLILSRDRLTRMLSSGRARRLTSFAATWSMPVFLWHMSAMVLATATSLVTTWASAGLLGISPLGGAWWATRPLWWLVLSLWTLPLIGVSVLVGRRTARVAGRSGPGSRGRGIVLVASAVAVAAVGTGSSMIDRPVVALVSLASLVAVAGVLGARPGRPERPVARREGAPE